MPKQMPRFDLVLSAYAHDADQIVLAGESSRPRVAEWTTRRLESLYELAYLRVFAAWESILESIFLRSLCGFASRAGQETLVTGTYYRTIANAEIAALGGQSYMLWHNPTKVVTRCRKHISSGGAGPAYQETVLSSNLSRLHAFAAVRHRIVHDQSDAKKNFDAATLLLAGKKYAAARPGKFLRDVDTSSYPRQKWLDTAVAEMTGLASQMV